MLTAKDEVSDKVKGLTAEQMIISQAVCFRGIVSHRIRALTRRKEMSL
jgi:DNA-binding response OmpR family regulator